MYNALCLSYHSNIEAVLFTCLSSGWATTMGRLLCSKLGNSIKCLPQGHSDALLHRVESKKNTIIQVLDLFFPMTILVLVV